MGAALVDAHSTNPQSLSQTLCVLLDGKSGSDSATGRRKLFVATAAVVYGIALLFVAAADRFGGFLIGMAIAGVGFGVYAAVGLALVADVLPDPDNAAEDRGVFNTASALPQSVAPAIAPAILAISGGSYSVLFAVAGGIAVLSAPAILPVRAIR